MEGFGKVQNVSYKGKINLVTEMDRRSEDTIVSILSRAFPDHGILAEESQEKAIDTTYRWILDPLDGTTNYAHGYPFFCISLALEKNKKPLLGIIYDPVRDELFVAEQGRGATLNGKPIHVSPTNTMSRSFLCTGFPYDIHESKEDNLIHFQRLIKIAQAIRRDGAAALDLCYVAMGRFDGFWEIKLNVWDVAAGSIIVTEAGGMVSDFKGEQLELWDKEILATNGLIHREMVEVLSQRQE